MDVFRGGIVDILDKRMLNRELSGRKKMGKTIEKINVCSKGGHAEAWCDSRRWGEMEAVVTPKGSSQKIYQVEEVILSGLSLFKK